MKLLLHYSNSLLSGSPKHLLDKLQKVQNSAARLVFKGRKHEHIKPFPQKRPWLPVVSRIQYKVATLCYKSFTESYSVYRSEPWLSIIHPDNFAPFLTPESSAYLSQNQRPLNNELFLSRARHLLPYDVRHSASTSSIKQALKTHLFKSAYK